jgi:hypothetical protein
MKKSYLALAFLAASSLVSVSAVSAAGYGMGGCGLGSLIISSNNIMQIFAVTTNGTSYNATFAITSGTSNCTPGGAAHIEAEQEMFVTVNYSVLEQEMAMGSGERLTALSGMLGCSKSEVFGDLVKRKYGELFKGTPTPAGLLASLKRETAGICKI